MAWVSQYKWSGFGGLTGRLMRSNTEIQHEIHKSIAGCRWKCPAGSFAHMMSGHDHVFQKYGRRKLSTNSDSSERRPYAVHFP